MACRRDHRHTFVVESRCMSVPSDAIDELTALARAGQFAAMEARTRRFLARSSGSGFLWKALGFALQMQGKDAVHALQRAASLLPRDPEVHSNLGAVLRGAGRPGEAVEAFRRALALQPQSAEIHSNLGNALRDRGESLEAVAAFRRALDLNPKFAKAHNNLGTALADLGREAEAMESYGRAVLEQPDYAEAHNNLAIMLRSQGRGADAERSCRRALELEPDHPAAQNLLAELHSDRGDFVAAEALYRRLLARHPASAEAWAGIAGLRRMAPDDVDWLTTVRRLAEVQPLPRQELSLRYALGKYYDDVGDFDQAFEHYRRANEVAKQLHPAYDGALLVHTVDLIIQTFDAEWLRMAECAGDCSERPVFIVGMPRSGTSLAEQIAASHPEVHGAGELPFWSTTVAAAAREKMVSVGSEVLRAWAQQYLTVLNQAAMGKLRVIDKMPANFLYLGLIRAAFPKARIIHMERNPADTCLSIYFQNFGAAHSYANDLGNLAHYYTQYRRLMAHWQALLPAGAILNVPYESLVEQPETWSRAMVKFLGLSWDSACLQSHATSRTLSTFSKWQARQAINQRSVARWRHYEKYIGPLSVL